MSKPTAHKHPLNNPRAFQNALVKWFTTEGKNYPWRETHDAWAVLVSEIMLQQTQIATVLGKGHYVRFMERYPTPRDMAEATEQEVLKAWEGLGYYRRARNLHAAARAISRDHGGVFPEKYEQIRALPGIGQYTAGAVASFAYNQPQPIVDANVARVFSRLFDFQERIDTSAGNKQLWKWASELLSNKQPRIYNSALMELGQTYCSNKSAQCEACPVRNFCQCADPSSLPIKKSAAKITRTDEFAIYCVQKDRIMLEKLPEGGRRAGMWQLPRCDHHETLKLPLVHKSNYAITRYQVTLRVYAGKKTQPLKTAEWKNLADLAMLPMPSPDRRVLDALSEE
ncbi:MAG: A/G-specific adenine glycosylase [Akkermansiaceae bacterium]